MPGFCDAYVTLGVNPWGGQAGPDTLKIALQALAFHGFTNVESVGDGKWTERVARYLDRNQWKGPEIHKGRPPIVPNPEVSIPGSVYKTVKNDTELKKFLSIKSPDRTHIFHRNLGNYVPDLRFLYKLRVRYSKDQEWVLHTFADPLSAEEALGTGWNVIFHPINTDPPKFQLENIRWSPLMSIYYNQSKRREEVWSQERKEILGWSPFFRLSYGEVSKNFPESLELDENDLKKAEAEYKSYREQFIVRSFMKKNLIFGSGTGNPLVYPGVGALRELSIWEEVFSEWEKQNGLPLEEELREEKPGLWKKWKEIIFGKVPDRVVEEPKSEPVKIPGYRIDILNSLTRNTCRFIRANHGGEIRTGRSANFVLYEENPLAEKNAWFRPHSVYVKGRLQSGKKIK